MFRPVVEVAQRDGNRNVHVLAAALAPALAEMAPAAEEAGEEVEGVVGLVGMPAGLLVLFEAFVAVLVVNAAGFGRGEGVVGFGYGNEFVMGGGVVS